MNQYMLKINTVDELSTFVFTNCRTLSAVNVATACNRMAKLTPHNERGKRMLSSRNENVLQSAIHDLLTRALEVSEEFKPQELSNLMWALAKLDITPGAELHMAISRRAVATAMHFNPQNVTNMLWSLATLGIQPEPELMSALSRRAKKTVGEFTPQGVANMAWALAKLGIEPEAELISAILKRVASISGDFKPQDVANLLWSLVTLGVGESDVVAGNDGY